MDIAGNAVMDGMYRYSLTRIWDASLGRVCFILLNPSTADGHRDDPTIRRCIGFAREWGYGSLEVVNLFAFQATSPTVLKQSPDPVGVDNDTYILTATRVAQKVVVAWGYHGTFLDRGAQVLRLISVDIFALGLTQQGQPRHPLYVRTDVKVSSYFAHPHT